ncbi:unnamed protein product [Acanthoscelides obtectus]|uniref:Uncharacterized protein n=1 Tax=Acanthoscelides obtectus TaxID=200917 RepID=A0A9P0NUZ6_ACAOB|nr:unnamed protein product [Acanthoscelides obtectus]CAK1641306.1 hypothetical protein AOBTE_LOCUS12317 [Acanthoscelides obtectus]
MLYVSLRIAVMLFPINGRPEDPRIYTASYYLFTLITY